VTPKRQFRTRDDVFTSFFRKNRSTVKSVALLKKPQHEKNYSRPKTTAKSRIWGTETHEPIATKFFMPGAI